MNDAAAQCSDRSSGPECIDLSLTSSDDEDAPPGDAQRACALPVSLPLSALAQARAITIDKDHKKRQQENIKLGLMNPHPETKHYLGGCWFMAEVVANTTGNYQLQMTRAAPSLHFLPLLLAALPGKFLLRVLLLVFSMHQG